MEQLNHGQITLEMEEKKILYESQMSLVSMDGYNVVHFHQQSRATWGDVA